MLVAGEAKVLNSMRISLSTNFAGVPQRRKKEKHSREKNQIPKISKYGFENAFSSPKNPEAKYMIYNSY